MTRAQAVELIKRTHYGGIVPVDATHSDREVNIMLNMGIAAAAGKYYNDAVRLDNEDYIGDAFYTTLSGLTVAGDNSLETSITPLGMNIGISISGVTVSGLEKQPIPIRQNDVFLWNELPIEKGRAGYYIDGSKIQFISKVSLSGKSVAVRMIGVPDNNSLTDELNVPADMLTLAIEIAVAMLDKRRQEDMTSRTGKE